MLEKALTISSLRTVLHEFPHGIKYSFAYGSGVFQQKTNPLSNMLDLIFVVNNAKSWHAENLLMNPTHYAQPLRYLGADTITKYQNTLGAKVYYNTLVTNSHGRSMKYGIITENALIEDLLDWKFLYLAGRLHKPVETITDPEKMGPISTALVQNLQSALHVALILLPEHFTEINLYKTIASLSYNGDFRMIFGEDKNKVASIVEPQLLQFKKLYHPILKIFENYMDVPHVDQIATSCRQDTSPIAKIHHLNHLPRNVQINLVQFWTKGKKMRDAEDSLRAIAYNPDCSIYLDNCLKSIVWHSSVTQSLKGILTAGLLKSIIYSWRKIKKTIPTEKLKNTFDEKKKIILDIIKKVQSKNSSK